MDGNGDWTTNELSKKNTENITKTEKGISVRATNGPPLTLSFESTAEHMAAEHCESWEVLRHAICHIETIPTPFIASFTLKTRK